MPRVRLIAIALLAVTLGAASAAVAGQPVSADVKPGPWTSTETFVWSKLQAGEEADLGALCPGEAPSPENDNDKRWECRKISAGFLRDVLTRAPWQDALPAAGVRVVGARITGDLDLENASLVRELWVVHSLFGGDIVLRRARTENLIGLAGSVVTGTFKADSLRAGSDVLLQSGTSLRDDLSLRGAKIDGELGLTGATISGALQGSRLQVGQSLLIRSDEKHVARFKNVELVGAKIDGTFDLTGAVVSGALDGDALQVGRLLVMRVASFTDVNLRGAKIDGQIDLSGATVSGGLEGDTLQVGQDLFMRSDKDHTARFEQVVLVAAKIGANLDLRGATVGDLDLSLGSVVGELQLGDSGGKPTQWRHNAGAPGTLTLRNAQIGTLSDEMDDWPGQNNLMLAGFGFTHLGGGFGETEAQMRGRGMAWWDQWVRRDPKYSPTPYVQLAATFVAAGDRDAANEIRFLGRERERETRWRDGDYAGWLLLSGLSVIAGYGIGTYSFRVLQWVFDLALLGTVILWFTVPAVRRQHHGRLWCFGAGLSRVLPVVEINKEFTEFFNDPKRERLDAWQSFTFSILGVIGWILGGVLIAALAGLTQAP